MIPYLIKKELEFMKEEKGFPQRYHHKAIHQMKDFIKFFAMLFKNYNYWMQQETKRFNCPHAMKK